MAQWPESQQCLSSKLWQYVAQPASKGYYVRPSGACEHMYLSLYVRYFALPLTVQVRAVSVVASKLCMNSLVRFPYLIVKP